MLNLSEIISDNREILRQSTVGEQFAMHALTRDSDGLLTYSKILWNSNDTVDLTSGEGFAYGLEELLQGTTSEGVALNDVARSKRSGVHDVPKMLIFTCDNVMSTNPYYIIDGEIMPDITLLRGHTYRFNVASRSTESFPLFISTQPTGGTYEYEYLSGVKNSRTAFNGNLDPNTSTDKDLEFTIPWDAPDRLFYASGNNTNMFGTILVASINDTNLNARRYEQVRFDHQKLCYFINDDGFLVARYGADHDYSAGPA
jgi:Ca2+-binding RTX toxin-like protein